jgi:NADH:ubiquinone oxidoreductase subunit 6 (subunit J)
MKGNSPIATNEMRFLDHPKDLVSLTPQTVSDSKVPSPVHSAIIIASAAIILPLLAFSMIAEFAGRILVVAVVGGAAAAIASHYSTGTEHLVKSQDGWRVAGLYVP